MSQPVPLWGGVVTAEGDIKVDARGLFMAYVKRLKGQAITIVVKKASRAKSRSQTGYLFGVLYPVIAEELGYREYEVAEVHDAFMRKLRGLRPDPNPMELRVSLATMSHEEVSEYIEDVRHLALNDFGIVTPDATKVEERAARRRDPKATAA